MSLRRERPRRLEEVPLPGGDRRICRMIFDELCVLANGDVVCSCGDPSGKLVYGNVFRDRLVDLYNGHTYYALRHWQLRTEPTSWCPVIGIRCGGRVSRPEPGDRPDGRRVRRLQIEPISRCNLACPECPVTRFDQDPAYRPDRVAQLPLETMLDVVDQLPDLEKILFYNFGEPFLHPRAIDFLRAVRARRPEVVLHTSTNGLALTRDKVEMIAAEALVDRIVFSIDGAREESYRRYRVGGSFERALANLERLADACRRHGTRGRVEILWQYILFEWNDGDAELARAQELAAQIGVPLSWVVTHTRGASRRFTEGRPELRELLGSDDLWPVATCDLRAAALERDGGVAAGRSLAHLSPRPLRTRVRPGGRYAIALEIANGSRRDWPDPEGRRFRVGVRLRSATGADLGELPALPLPAAARRAGGSACLPLDGRAPTRPGRYQLLIDVVEEGVAWFAERGSAPATIELEVVDGAPDDWSARSAAATATLAALGQAPPPLELEAGADQLEAGTPIATWISWLTDGLAAGRDEARARALAASLDALGRDAGSAQPGSASAFLRGWTSQAPKIPSR